MRDSVQMVENAILERDQVMERRLALSTYIVHQVPCEGTTQEVHRISTSVKWIPRNSRHFLMFSFFFSFFFDEIYSFSVVYGAQFAIYKFYK